MTLGLKATVSGDHKSDKNAPKPAQIRKSDASCVALIWFNALKSFWSSMQQV